MRSAFGSSPQFTFPNVSGISATTDDANGRQPFTDIQQQGHYESTGTFVTHEHMSGIHVATYNTSATLHAFVEGFPWQKGGRSLTQVQTSAQIKPAANVFAVVRTQRVYIDRRTIFLAYSAHDEDGSFRVAQDVGFSVAFNLMDPSTPGTLHTAGLCNHTAGRLVNVSHRYTDYCEITPDESAFLALSSNTPHDTQFSLLPHTGATPLMRPTASVTLSQPPAWYAGELRMDDKGLRSAAPAGTTTGVFYTLPTHPLYASNNIDDRSAHGDRIHCLSHARHLGWILPREV